MPIVLENVSYTYMSGSPLSFPALHGVSLTIQEGEFLGVIGHTGAGKSTLMQHLNGLLVPTSGRVLVDGFDTRDKKQRAEARKRVGMVFQYPEYQLFEESVYKDIAFGPKNMRLSEAEVDEHVREAASFVGVDEALFDRSPLELSGGQKRRIAIAGVIAMRPGVLILDEPTAGLDPDGCRQILQNICDYRDKTGSTVILVSHSMDDVARIADRLIVFSHGGIFMDGAPEEVFSHPGELTDIGLSVPEPTAIAMALRKRGVELPKSIYTSAQLIEAVKALGREAGVC